MLKTFSIGGVHPHENKLSAHQPIITAEVSAKAVILLGQHIGAPAKPIVAKGDMVKVGTKIAEPAGFVGLVDHPVDEGAQEIAFAELDNPFRIQHFAGSFFIQFFHFTIHLKSVH